MANERAEADLRKLQAKRDTLRAELADVDTRIEKLQIYLEMESVYGAYGAGAAQLPAPTASGSGYAGTTRRSPASGISGKSVELTKAALREAGHPIHTRDLLKMLAAQDVHVGGANPVANLSGFLSKSDDLRNSRKYGWSLAEWPTEFGPSSVAHEQPATPHPTPASPPHQAVGGDLNEQVTESTDGTSENDAQEYIE